MSASNPFSCFVAYFAATIEALVEEYPKLVADGWSAAFQGSEVKGETTSMNDHGRWFVYHAETQPEPFWDIVASKYKVYEKSIRGSGQDKEDRGRMVREGKALVE